MKPEKKNKDFDCLELKEQIQGRIYEEIKDLSPEEEIEYFKKKAKASGLVLDPAKSSK